MTVDAEALKSGIDTSAAQAALFVSSEKLPDEAVRIQGPDFNRPFELQQLLDSYARIGFQAAGLSRAIEVIDKMRAWRLSDEPLTGDESEEEADPAYRARTSCHILLGYTSNLISSGLREIIRFLVQHKYVTGICTTAGGIEEDLIKCLGPTYLTPQGSFDQSGADLRKRGLNRIGNLIVPNDNYCKFEDWVNPILDQLVVEQGQGAKWSPSKVIERLGREIDDESSVLYWAAKNNIPVFCPALTDGSLGDMIFCHSFKSDTPLVIDIVEDIRRLNYSSMRAKKAGTVILGGGVCKHQILNSFLYRNGADYSVYINTGQEFDGSDSGARPDEAISWGKLRAGSETVKVFADATLIFPLVVAATWAKSHWQKQAESKTNGHTTQSSA
ncbi:uncharacterized protein L969DRAFT_20370 [Mixia osmundae IAM 14324]|uniref:deoxyhypusine synthase n=1 Tax=Mixia osmundae (strain CBS 9802 / IAM 14324 / JCM 22182 / KY 12970) TaxID=764103 RepID=G7DV23_MIXOS|nr:uncharacterized protein L969DRAFT_20370 [Mixia osmundae IAM 14324]KEI36350.1 hypothetical protein L969DRAFT_20370 [Mixia osmundae IAM 14324]GAA94433.1 hypothetical protein E5Q_01085 [Mixia osmundae IAM 14324]